MVFRHLLGRSKCSMGRRYCAPGVARVGFGAKDVDGDLKPQMFELDVGDVGELTEVISCRSRATRLHNRSARWNQGCTGPNQQQKRMGCGRNRARSIEISLSVDLAMVLCFLSAPRGIKGFTNEAHVSAPQHAACSHAWLPFKDVDERWPQSHQQSSSQGSRPSRSDDLQEVTTLLPTDGTSPPSPPAPRATREKLPRSRRLLRREDFLRVQEGGVRVSTRHFLLLLEPRDDGGPTRLGIVASRKVGGAVQRNRAKRLLRETFRRNSKLFPQGVNLVVIVRPGVDALSRGDVEAEISGVSSLLRKRMSGRSSPVRADRSPPKHRA